MHTLNFLYNQWFSHPHPSDANVDADVASWGIFPADDADAAISQGIFTTPQMLDSYERVWHTEIYQAAWDTLAAKVSCFLRVCYNC